MQAPIEEMINRAYSLRTVSALGVGSRADPENIGAAFSMDRMSVIGPRRPPGAVVILKKPKRSDKTAKSKMQFAGKFARVLSNAPNKGGWVYVEVFGETEPIAWRNKQWTYVTNDLAAIVSKMPDKSRNAFFAPVAKGTAKEHLSHLPEDDLKRVLPTFMRLDPDVAEGTPAQRIADQHYARLKREVGSDMDVITAMAATGDMRFVRATTSPEMLLEVAARTGLLDSEFGNRTVLDYIQLSKIREEGYVRALLAAAAEGNRSSVDTLLGLDQLKRNREAQSQALETSARYGRVKVAALLSRKLGAEVPTLAPEPAWTIPEVVIKGSQEAEAEMPPPPTDDEDILPPPDIAPPAPTFAPDMAPEPQEPAPVAPVAPGSDFLSDIRRGEFKLKKAAPKDPSVREDDLMGATEAFLAARRMAIAGDDEDSDDESELSFSGGVIDVQRDYEKDDFRYWLRYEPEHLFMHDRYSQMEAKNGNGWADREAAWNQAREYAMRQIDYNMVEGRDQPDVSPAEWEGRKLRWANAVWEEKYKGQPIPEKNSENYEQWKTVDAARRKAEQGSALAGALGSLPEAFARMTMTGSTKEESEDTNDADWIASFFRGSKKMQK